ncbi:hypothetical protein GCM10027570_40390 [Streptomonospora sediminis]
MPQSPPARTNLPDWQLRVIRGGGGPAAGGSGNSGGVGSVGSGVVVSPFHVLTCAHVVEAALPPDRRTADPAGPRTAVRLDAPRGADGWQATGTVVDDGWFRDRAPWDIAVLRLDRPAPAAPPVLRPAHGAEQGTGIGIVGFSDAAAGVWVYGTLGGSGGSAYEHVQLDVRPAGGLGVVAGFSGGGVRDQRDGALLGILCEAWLEGTAPAGVCWMIPIEAVPPVWEQGPPAQPQQQVVGSAPAEPGPRRTAELGRAVGQLRTVLIPDRRQDFYLALDRRLRDRLKVDAEAGVFASQLVNLAREYELLGEVLGMLEAAEEGSRAMGGVWDAAAPFPGGHRV